MIYHPSHASKNENFQKSSMLSCQAPCGQLKTAKKYMGQKMCTLPPDSIRILRDTRDINISQAHTADIAFRSVATVSFTSACFHRMSKFQNEEMSMRVRETAA